MTTAETQGSELIDTHATPALIEPAEELRSPSVMEALRSAGEALSQSSAWTVGSLMALHLLTLVIFVTPIDAPTIYPDEFAYIAIARDFAGNYPDAQFVDLVYQFGYGAMLAPIAAVFDSPYGFHAAAQWLNIVMALSVGPMLYSILRGVFDLSIARAGVASALGVLAPATMVQPSLLWAESAFTMMTVASMLGLVRFVDRPTPLRGVLLAMSLAWAYAVHPRGLVLIIAFVIVLASLAFRRTVGGATTAITAGCLAVLWFVVREVQAGVADRVFTSGTLPLEAANEADLIVSSAIPNADRWLRGLVGAVWYQGLVTVGLVVVVAAWALELVRRHLRNPDKESTLALTLGLAWGGALVVGALVFLGAERRIDHAVYGRYTGHLTPLLLAIGAALVLRNPGAQVRALRLAIVLVALGAVATRLAHPWGFWAGGFAFPNATVFGTVGDIVGLREPLRVGLVSSLVLIAFLRSLQRWGSVALLLPAGCLLAVAFAANVTEIDPRSEWSERNFEFTAQFASDDAIGPIVIGDEIDVFITRYGVQYWRPDLQFVNESNATDASEYWMTSSERRRPTADARLVRANSSFDVRFWIRPGEAAEEMEFRNALFWPDIDLDVRLPHTAMRAEVATAGPTSFDLDAGETEAVRVLVRHTGEDYPWPTGAALIGEFSVRVGARWFLDGEEITQSRAEFASSVRPEQTRIIRLPLTALDGGGERIPPGVYEVRVDVVQDFVAWFGDMGGSEPLVLTVTVL